MFSSVLINSFFFWVIVQMETLLAYPHWLHFFLALVLNLFAYISELFSYPPWYLIVYFHVLLFSHLRCVVLVTLRDIKQGEELFSNYYTIVNWSNKFWIVSKIPFVYLKFVSIFTQWAVISTFRNQAAGLCFPEFLHADAVVEAHLVGFAANLYVYCFQLSVQ